MTLRVAVVGTGFGANIHIPAFRLLRDVDVVAIVSSRRNRAQSIAERHGIPNAFDNYSEMLATVAPDLVTIATPPYLHHSMALEAIERGIHVLCEKPLALNVQEAREMVAEAERRGVIAAVNHEFRFLPVRAAFRERIRRGDIGTPHQVQIQWHAILGPNGQPGPYDWWSSETKGGGILGAVGSHYIDCLLWWFGPIVEVASVLDARVPFRPDSHTNELRAVTSDDTTAVLLRMESGAVINLSLTAVAGVRGSRVEAHGPKGSLVIENDERLLYGAAGGAMKLQELSLGNGLADASHPPMLAAFIELATHVVGLIKGDRSTIVPGFRDGLAVQAVMHAIQQAGRNRRWATVDRVDGP
ncbi:Gfo/Idh/MocA family protein [Microvirga antarctica]|uniref:Gfo/Idh/MocA family protein n=1 Tax=Microvirga antarctica TaxID=2819233 RepID=UPI001B30D501|nr:Gfo/Idh/MocA family oxidoreductase [Microvirga antarctica]